MHIGTHTQRIKLNMGLFVPLRPKPHRTQHPLLPKTPCNACGKSIWGCHPSDLPLHGEVAHLPTRLHPPPDLARCWKYIVLRKSLIEVATSSSALVGDPVKGALGSHHPSTST